MIQRIFDIAHDLQTDNLKQEIYHSIQSFVYKNYRRYHPHFKGDLHDLVVDFYTDFTRPKKRRNGEVFSELDRFEYHKLGGDDWDADDSKRLAAYIQRFVWHRLIDRERTDKREINYTERYDEETGDLSLDYLAKLVDEDDDRLEDLEFTPKLISQAQEAYNNMSSNTKKDFLKIYEQIKHNLPENLKDLFGSLVGDDHSSQIKTTPKSRGQLPEIKEILSDIQSAIPNAKIDSYKLRGSKTVRVMFDTREESEISHESLDKILNPLGFNFYKQSGKAWYYMV